MRYIHIRCVLVVVVAGLLLLPATLLCQQESSQASSARLTKPAPTGGTAVSHARVVRLSYVSGTVMLKRPGATAEETALLNTPIQEGFELSTSATSYAEVEFENGSTARLGELSKVIFQQLALDANGNKLNGMTFSQGYATFHFIPEHQSRVQRREIGAAHLESEDRDSYRLKLADVTVSADGKCEFRTDLAGDRFRVEVFSGSVEVSTDKQSSRLGEGRVLEHQSENSAMAFNTREGIVKDAWD